MPSASSSPQGRAPSPLPPKLHPSQLSGIGFVSFSGPTESSFCFEQRRQVPSGGVRDKPTGTAASPAYVEQRRGRLSGPRLGLLAQVLKLIPASVVKENFLVSSATAGSPVSGASRHRQPTTSHLLKWRVPSRLPDIKEGANGAREPRGRTRTLHRMVYRCRARTCRVPPPKSRVNVRAGLPSASVQSAETQENGLVGNARRLTGENAPPPLPRRTLLCRVEPSTPLPSSPRQ